jgi:hypothetical protein
LKRAPDSAGQCSDLECAKELARTGGADEAVFGSVRSLGRKLFFSSTIVGADGSGYFTQQIGVANVEDFEAATRRMAEAISKRQTIEEVANVDNITEKEDNLEVNRRRHFYSTGASLGYMFPINGSYRRWKLRDDCDDYFDCPETEIRDQRYSQIVKLGWNNWFEFKNNLAMEVDVLWFAPIALGADVNLDYFFANNDFTPFAGGGLGLHYVLPDQGIRKDSDKRNSGPTLNAQAGMIFFRTYSLNLVVRGQYHMIFNDDFDHGPSVDVALRTRMGGGGNDKYHRTSATTWLGAGLGVAYVLALLIAAGNS